MPLPGMPPCAIRPTLVTLLATLLGLLAWNLPRASANIVSNGDFSNGLTGWTPTGNLVAFQNSVYWNSGDNAPNGVLTQTLLTTPGRYYTFAFDYGVLSFSPSSQSLDVDVVDNGSTLFYVRVTDSSPGSPVTFDHFAYGFVAASSSTTIRFRDVATNNTVSIDGVLDNVDVEPVYGFTVNQVPFLASAGVAWGEAYGDAGAELGITVPGGMNVWYTWDGGTFIGGAGFGDQTDTKAAAWGDYDNDGLMDIVSAASFGIPSLVLYHNVGGGNFIETTMSVFSGGASQCRGLGWSDFDRDGDLDLCVARQGGSGATLFLNDGTNLFDWTGFATATGVAWGDYDNDRWPDLYLSDLSGASHLYHNVSGSFVDVTTPTLANTGGVGYQVQWIDFDNDGDLDLYVGNSTAGGGAASRLFKNNNLTAAGFVDWTASSGIVADRGNGAWADYDGDGRLDLCAQHSTGNRLWRNVGGGAFVDVTTLPVGLPTDGGIAWGDLDADGWPDLAFAYSAGPTIILHNDGTDNHVLVVDLIGTTSNRFGIGARIEVVAGGQRQMREVSGSAGYLGQNAATADFGLGAATSIDSLIVTWPTGARQVVTPVPAADSWVHVTEDATTAVGGAPAQAVSLAAGPNPFSVRTLLTYTLARDEEVRLEVFDLGGRSVKTLVSGRQPAGRHETAWDGVTDRGDRVPAGVYLCRLRAGSVEMSRRIVCLTGR